MCEEITAASAIFGLSSDIGEVPEHSRVQLLKLLLLLVETAQASYPQFSGQLSIFCPLRLQCALPSWKTDTAHTK